MSGARLSIGIAFLARATFDVPYAEQIARKAWEKLEDLDADLIGSSQLLFDAPAVRSVLDQFRNHPLDLLLVVQVTFSDATLTVELAQNIDAPLLLWSFPEPRSGGRLRLNSVCGINLAAHALGRAGLGFDFIHAEPEDETAVTTILRTARAGKARNRLNQARIGLIGHHPDGFDTCTYDAAALSRLCGTRIEPVSLEVLFERARAVTDQETQIVYNRVQQQLKNLDRMEAQALDKSLKIYSALHALATERDFDALAVRCWPEMFTEFGAAACGPMAMLNEEMVPSACEADVYGAISSLILQWLNDAPVFMTDMVDFNTADDSAVFWHCGLAPLSMADPGGPRRATIHSNRKLPFLNEFALKPGRISMLRLSQSGNQTRFIVGGGEMLQAPLSFSGTAGVVRFDRPSAEVLRTIIHEGLEHHVSITYGDCRGELGQLARLLGIDVLELC